MASLSPASGAWANTAGGPGGSTYAAHVSVGPVTQYANFGTNFKNVAAGVNISAYTGVVFDVMKDPGNIGTIRVALADVNTDPNGGVCTTNCSDYHGANVCLSTSWQSVTVFFNQMTQQGYGVPQGALDLTQAYGLYFQFTAGVGGGIWVDNIKFTTAAPPAPLSSAYISDFDFNSGGTNINPGLTNFLAGGQGWTSFVASPVTQLLPFVGCYGYASPFGARLMATFTEPGGVYNSASLSANLYTGTNTNVFPVPSTATYYDMTPFTGVDFWFRVDVMTASLALFVPTSNTTPAGVNLNGDGSCGGTCWDHFVNYMTPYSNGVWTHKTIPFSAFTRGGWGPASLAPCSSTVFDACNKAKVMQLQWAAGSGGVAGTYNVDFTVDNVMFY